jgi:hypothetical protein
MAKEKLFTPEDFDKVKDTPWYNKPLVWILGIVIAVCAIGGLYYLLNESQNSINDNNQFTQNTIIPMENDTCSDNISNDTIVSKQRDEDLSEDRIVPNDHQDELSSLIPTKQSYHRGETFEIDAKMAIRGDFGNGIVRMQRLGSDYETVQTIVNQFIREGKTKW